MLDRTAFRMGVFARDGMACVMCGKTGKLDAHHIMERRLFPDGGYYLDNGVTLCDPDCHMKAEQTVYSTEKLRQMAGIKNIILPPHLYKDEKYDKWGNAFLPNGQRIRGELFYDESVQRVLKPVLDTFTKYVKYPRTYHFPWSPGISKDDRVLSERDNLLYGAEVIVTEKRDGENTTFYQDYIHARSIGYSPHPSRDYVKSIWANMCFDIPFEWRICGENLFAQHSIAYTDIRSYFEVFSIWDSSNYCLPWDSTVEWVKLVNLVMVPELYRGPYNETLIRKLAEDVVKSGKEGIVVRRAAGFHYSQFSRAVAKYVRKDHVQTHGHWMRLRLTPNKLANEV